jgi:small GTP-binding protein
MGGNAVGSAQGRNAIDSVPMAKRPLRTRAKTPRYESAVEPPPYVHRLRNVLPSTSNGITAIAVSDDQLRLAIAQKDGLIQIFDFNTSAVVSAFQGQNQVNQLLFDPTGRLICSAGDGRGLMRSDGTAGRSVIEVWNIVTETFMDAFSEVSSGGFGWSPDSTTLAVACNGKLRLWDALTRRVSSLTTDIHVSSLCWSPQRRQLVLGGSSPESKGRARRGHVHCLDLDTNVFRPLMKVSNREVKDLIALAWSSDSHARWLAGARDDGTIWVLDTANGKEVVLEGGGPQPRLVFSEHGKTLVSFHRGVTCWRCGDWQMLDSVSTWRALESPHYVFVHDQVPWIATSEADGVSVWSVDTTGISRPAMETSIRYATARIVLVGDSGVGKTGLAWRLVEGIFKEHPSTHGQQFWLWKALSTSDADGEEREAIVWDLAGQPDYRLIHGLFLDAADLALVLFDPAHPEDPLHGVEFWLKQLRVGETESTPAILVAARADRGSGPMSAAELEAFCRQSGFKTIVTTSAFTGEGIDSLVSAIKSNVKWDRKPASITTKTFHKIKEYVLALRADPANTEAIVDPVNFRHRLMPTSMNEFSVDELLTSARHLETHGYVTILRTSSGDVRILLAPDILNNLAASFIVEARRNIQGLGSLDERRLLAGEYDFRELSRLSHAERAILLDAVVVMFLKANLCFRGTDPLGGKSYLIFPALINLKKPSGEDIVELEDGASYTVSGAVENVYSTVVVLLGYTQTFTRTAQWRNQARYVVGDGSVCGFRLEGERPGELDFTLYFGVGVTVAIRKLFEGLFESLLGQRPLRVLRYDPVVCQNGHRLNKEVLRDSLQRGEYKAFCNRCGSPVLLKTDLVAEFDRDSEAIGGEQREAADRARFEQAVFQVNAHVKRSKISIPQCFISYAWGDPSHEQWVEYRLARDLQKAGIEVVLDRWDNARLGSSVSRFVERVALVERVVVVGTRAYKKKYKNRRPMGGYVVAAEGDLIGRRMTGSELRKSSIMPVLLDGTEVTAFPELLQGRVYADFRRPADYFVNMFDLILSVYGIAVTDRAVADGRASLRLNPSI